MRRIERAADAGIDGDRTLVSEHGVPLARTGRRFDRSSPFVIGLTATLCVAIAYGVVRAIVDLGDVLSLVLVALVVAIGLDPVVRFLTRHHLPRPWAVAVVTLGFLAVVGGVLAAAAGPVSHEAHRLADDLPRYRDDIAAGKGTLGRLAVRLHVANSIGSQSTNGVSSRLLGGALGVGRRAVTALTSLVVVFVLTVYFLAALPVIEATGLRFAPASRRPHARGLMEAAFARVSGFVLGDLITSLVAGLATFAWMEGFGLPYPILLGVLVAVVDLIPFGSTAGGVVVSLIALTHSLPVALATAGFYTAFRLAEDYLLTPRVMAHTVKVSAGLTIIATLAGGALLGIIGALVAIPVTAVIQLLVEEMLFPHLDAS